MKVAVLLILWGSLCTEELAAQSKSSSISTEPSETTGTQVTRTKATDAQTDIGKTTSSAATEANVVTGSSSRTQKPNTSEKSQTTTLSYNEWKEENEKRLEEKFDKKRREDQDKANNGLMRNIQSALARPGLSAAKRADLNYVYNLLKRAAEVNDAGVKKAAYDEALNVLVSVLSQ